MHYLNLQEGKKRARRATRDMRLRMKGSPQMENNEASNWPLLRVERLMVRTRSKWHPAGKDTEQLTLADKRDKDIERQQLVLLEESNE